MNWRAADRIEEAAPRGSRESAERHRRVGRAEGREADLGDRLLLHGGGDGERVHVGELALIGGHAGRGVALDVLDAAHALLNRKLDVADRDIVLHIDEGFQPPVAEHMQRCAEGSAPRGRCASDRVRVRRRRLEPGRSRCGPPGRVALREPLGEPEGAVASAGRAQARSRLARTEGLERRVEDEPPARLREEVHGRRPAARHEERVAFDSAHTAGPRREADRPHPRSPLDPMHGGARRDRDPERAGGLRQRPLGRIAKIGDQRDLDARLAEVGRRAIGAVGGRHDDDALAGLDAVEVEIAPRRLGQHDSRTVVVGENERAFDRAGRQHDLAGAHAPQFFARQIRVRGERRLGRPLAEPDHILSIGAEGLRSRHEPHVRRRAQRLERRRQPGARRLAVDRRPALRKERSAGRRVLVADDDVAAAFRRR